jgi:hypothetical protein
MIFVIAFHKSEVIQIFHIASIFTPMPIDGSYLAAIAVMITVIFPLVILVLDLPIRGIQSNVSLAEVGGNSFVLVIAFEAILIRKRIPVVQIAGNGEFKMAERIAFIVHKSL